MGSRVLLAPRQHPTCEVGTTSPNLGWATGKDLEQRVGSVGIIRVLSPTPFQVSGRTLSQVAPLGDLLQTPGLQFPLEMLCPEASLGICFLLFLPLSPGAGPQCCLLDPPSQTPGHQAPLLENSPALEQILGGPLWRPLTPLVSGEHRGKKLGTSRSLCLQSDHSLWRDHFPDSSLPFLLAHSISLFLLASSRWCLALRPICQTSRIHRTQGEPGQCPGPAHGEVPQPCG